MNTESFAYKLAETAVALAKSHSIGHAKEFLVHEIKRNQFVMWEQVATIGYFKYLLGSTRIVRRK